MFFRKMRTGGRDMRQTVTVASILEEESGEEEDTEDDEGTTDVR